MMWDCNTWYMNTQFTEKLCARERKGLRNCKRYQSTTLNGYVQTREQSITLRGIVVLQVGDINAIVSKR